MMNIKIQTGVPSTTWPSVTRHSARGAIRSSSATCRRLPIVLSNRAMASRRPSWDTASTKVFSYDSPGGSDVSVSYTHLRAHETPEHLVCRLLLEKKKKHHAQYSNSIGI
eukprot:TRINITY_DN57702_c0_g1_i1.p1 TRINITY_DN57702_c0_g1~~TRINITY_DN57702_c0_g1_i1.p1  ORF type:complete len:110 (-),score=1.30 TRINITY_DN57702_c0_g1_i1:48-377(-)